MKTVLVLVLSLATPVLQAKGSAPTAADPMVQLNLQFRDAYKAARQRAQDGLDSVIVAYSGDKLVWLHKGTRRETTYLTPLYHDLKTNAHLTLALLVLLERPTAAPLDSQTRVEVERLLAQAQQAGRTWSGRGFSPDQLKRQQVILQACQAFVNDVLRRGHFVPPGDMYPFIQSLRVPVAENIREAARLHLDLLHKQVQSWRKDMGEAAWAQLRVVVVTPHMPSQNELSIQYFLQAMRQSEEGSRLVTAQTPCDDATALQLLATHELDGSAGERFFDRPLRMHRDILANAVTEYLDEVSVAAAPQ